MIFVNEKNKLLRGVVNTIMGDNCTALSTRGNGHGSGTSSSLHQAVTWSLSSPFYNDTIHLTGVYILPNEGKLEMFFDTLITNSHHPSHEPHIYEADFNAYTAEEIENRITPFDPHTLFHCRGDFNPDYSPTSPPTTASAPGADYRGRLQITMFNSIKFVVSNDRFPVPSPND